MLKRHVAEVELTQRAMGERKIPALPGKMKS
jgi:hypothetical protein